MNLVMNLHMFIAPRQQRSCLAGSQMSLQDHTGKQNSCYDPCQDPNQDFFLPLDPVRIPAGKLFFPATFFISWQDPGREQDSWWDPAKKPFYKPRYTFKFPHEQPVGLLHSIAVTSADLAKLNCKLPDSLE